MHTERHSINAYMKQLKTEIVDFIPIKFYNLFAAGGWIMYMLAIVAGWISIPKQCHNF